MQNYAPVREYIGIVSKAGRKTAVISVVERLHYLANIINVMPSGTTLIMNNVICVEIHTLLIERDLL